MAEKWRIPALPPLWQDFLVWAMMRLALPMIPLILELWATQTVSERTLTLAGWMYAIVIGVSARNALVFALGVLLGAPLAFASFVAAAGEQPLLGSGYVAGGVILAMFAIDSALRYNRRTGKGQSVFQLGENGNG